MSAPPDPSSSGKQVAVRYGLTSFLFERSRLSGCAYYLPVSGASGSCLFFQETLRHGGEDVPVFDLDRCLDRLFRFGAGSSFPLALVFCLDGADPSDIDVLRMACAASGAPWNGRYLACRLRREASVMSCPVNLSGSLPAPLSGLLRERGFTGFSFASDGTVCWQIDAFRFMRFSVDGVSGK